MICGICWLKSKYVLCDSWLCKVYILSNWIIVLLVFWFMWKIIVCFRVCFCFFNIFLWKNCDFIEVFMRYSFFCLRGKDNFGLSLWFMVYVKFYGVVDFFVKFFFCVRWLFECFFVKYCWYLVELLFEKYFFCWVCIFLLWFDYKFVGLWLNFDWICDFFWSNVSDF